MMRSRRTEQLWFYRILYLLRLYENNWWYDLQFKYRTCKWNCQFRFRSKDKTKIVIEYDYAFKFLHVFKPIDNLCNQYRKGYTDELTIQNVVNIPRYVIIRECSKFNQRTNSMAAKLNNGDLASDFDWPHTCYFI